MRSQGARSAAVLAALGVVVVVVREPSALSVAGAIACFLGAALSLFLAEKQVRSLRHEYRYEDEGPSQ